MKLNLFFFLLSVFLFLGCSIQPVVTHPSRQAQTKPQTEPTPEEKKVKSRINESIATPPVVVKPNSPTPVEVKIVPKVQTPESLLKNVSNIGAVNNLIENTLSLNELEAAAADESLTAFKPHLLLKIGKVYQKNKDNDRAGEYYRSLATMYPQSTYATQASVLLASIQSTTETNANVIGAILPLTGRSANIGQHALNSLRLGLGLTKGETKFRIALFDSQSDPDLAVKGVDKLINEDKAIVILGGFSAKEAVAIANRTELFSIPFVAFSQKPGLTNIGEYVFRNALTPEMQVDRLVSFAFEKLSAKRFAILYPNDSYGVEFGNSFWDHVLARGGQVTAAQIYDPKTTDFSEIVQKMVGTYYDEARKDELKQRTEELKLNAKKREKDNKGKPQIFKSQRDSYSDANVLPPIVDFDVLFVPDNSRALGQVLAFMKYNDVTDMNYLGTNLWNSSDLPKRAANEDAGIYFVDSVDIHDSEVRESPFFKEYFETYNEEPTIVEIQTYEAARIIREQILSGATGRETLAASLRGLGSAPGIIGKLEMNEQRELVRPVHVLMLDSGVVKKVQ
jgi:branched-chain amino acid transport system substrate-binding protein